jgi:hypothetical protein
VFPEVAEQLAQAHQRGWQLVILSNTDRDLVDASIEPVQGLPASPIDMSVAAWPSIDPARPLSAWALAPSRSRWRRNSRNNTASRTIMMGPPTNSARVNCQLMSRANMMPSSTTKLVEATSNAMAALRLAPLRNSERAKATAA